MEHLLNVLNSTKSISILDVDIPISAYCPIDLSDTNRELEGINVSDPIECQNYIDRVLQDNGAKVAFGGYLEKRQLYKEAQLFTSENPRNIHIGIDFWCTVGTKVLAPLDGKLHSFKNNAKKGDYGPTIILEHSVSGVTFYSLYGHLSLNSISGLEIGQNFRTGQVIATLGETAINVNYAPHLHFQLIMDIDGYFGDYPGVCSEMDLTFYIENCPNPNLILRL